MSQKNKKKIVTTLAAALVLLALISFCLMGSTMARYTSGGSGTATTNVAYWGVTGTTAFDSSSTVTIAKLSPDKDGQSGQSTTKFVNYSSVIEVAVLTIDKETAVDVDVTLTVDDIDIKYIMDVTQTTTPKYSVDNNDKYKDDVTKALDITVVYATSQKTVTGTGAITGKDIAEDTSSTYTEVTSNGVSDFTASTSADNVAYYVYAYASWTTDYGTNGGGDALDNWIGKYVESISTTITCTAVQNSTVNSAS